MRIFLPVLFGLFCFNCLNAQSAKRDLALDLRLASMPFIQKDNRLGGDLKISYYFTDQFSAGIEFLMTGKKFNQGFGYTTDRTSLTYFSALIPAQFDVINKSKLQVSFGLSAGVGVATLSDRNNYTTESVWDDSLNMFVDREVMNKLGNDTYLVINPNINILARLFDIKKEEGIGFYLSGNLGRKLSIGNGTFTNSKDFSGYVALIGFCIKGSTKSKL